MRISFVWIKYMLIYFYVMCKIKGKKMYIIKKEGKYNFFWKY